MNYYPVIIPTLNRYQHFKECVESLSECTHADKTELVIGLDYPPEEKYVDGWELIKKYIPTIKGFAKVTVFEHEYNLGVVDNFSYLINYVSNLYQAWISTEDDNVFAPSFLDFMNKCLEKYKFDKSVLCVSGTLEPNVREILGEFLENCEDTVVKLCGNLSAYGCGHWREKDRIIRQVWPKDFRKYVFGSRLRLLKLLGFPSKLEHVYFWIKQNPRLNISCDFTREVWEILHNMITVYPVRSLVCNNGFDGTGWNCDFSDSIQNSWKKIILSSNKWYDLIDGIHNSEIKKLSHRLEKSEKKTIKRRGWKVFCINFIFGYSFSQFFDEYVKKKSEKFKNCNFFIFFNDITVKIKNKVKSIKKSLNK